MAVKVHVDHLSALSMTERLGGIYSLVRMARVTFGERTDIPTDCTILETALLACDDAGYSIFSTIGDPKFSSVVLVERDAKLVSQDDFTVDVTLKYEHVLSGPNQILYSAPGILFGKGRSSITQKKTNSYYPFGDKTFEKQQILVAHTYPKEDTRRLTLLTLYKDTLPRTILQGGEIDVPFPQSNYSVQGVFYTDAPFSIARQFIACINNNVWLGEPACTWICSDVQWDVINPLDGSYHFAFEFQNNSDTWNPTVIFEDQETGKPPANIEVATQSGYNPNGSRDVIDTVKNPFTQNLQPAGVWSVPFLRQVDFNTLFNSFFEGAI